MTLSWALSSLLLAAAILAVRAAFKKRLSAGVRYALWAVLLLRLLIPGTLFHVALPVPAEPEAPVSGDPAPITEAPVLPAYDREAGAIYVPSPAPSEPPVTQATAFKVDLRELLPLVWAVGAGAAALVFVLANLRLYLALRKGRQPLKAESGLRVFTVPGLSSSCLFGNCIYLTPEAAGDPAVLGHVLAHEEAHHRHGDHIWAMLRCAALALHWFDPLVWLCALRSRDDSELFADAGAIRTLGQDQRESYGDTVIRLSTGRGIGLLTLSTAMSARGRSLRERITLIARGSRTALPALILAAALALFAVGCAFTGPKSPEPEPDPEPAVTTPDPEPAVTTPDPEPVPTPVTPEPEPEPEPSPVIIILPDPEPEPEPEPAAIAAPINIRVLDPTTGKYASQYYFDGSMFNQSSNQIVNHFLLSEYTAPKDIDLFWLFYDGYNGSQATDEERAALAKKLGREIHLDVTKVTSEQVERVLWEYARINLEQTAKKGLDRLTYLKEYDAYFLEHGDTAYEPVFFTSYRLGGAGNLSLIYERGRDTYTVTLRSYGSMWLFVSNVKN